MSRRCALFLAAAMLFAPPGGERNALTEQQTIKLSGQAETELVSVGNQVTRELRPGERFSLAVTLKPQEFLRLQVNGGGAGMEMGLVGPTGMRIAGALPLEESLAYLSIVSGVGGQHTIMISSKSGDAPVSTFRLSIKERRFIRKTDNLRVSADLSYLEALRLQKQWTRESDSRAAEKFEEVFRLSNVLRDWEMAARAQCRLGDLLQDRGRSTEALACYGRALGISKENGFRAGEADALAHIGLIKALGGEGQRSMELLQEALQISRDAAYLAGTALSLTNTGEAKYTVGNQREALTYYHEAVRLWRAAGDQRALAKTLYYLGSACSDLGQVHEAFAHYEESIRLWRAMGDRHGEALTLTLTGTLHGYVGENQQGLNRFREAAVLFKSGNDPVGEAMLMGNFAYIYKNLGDLDGALDYSRKALGLYRQAALPRGEAAQLRGIGEILHARGDDRMALDSLEEALSLYQSVNDQRLEGVSLCSIGRVQREMRNVAQAIPNLERALELSRSTDDLPAQSDALNELGLAYEGRGDTTRALACLLEALEVNQKAQDLSGEIRTRHNLAQIHRKTGNRMEALKHAQKSVDLIESLRIKVDVPSLRISYFSTIRRTYDLCVDLLMDLHRGSPAAGYDALAVQVSERARARNLLDLLGESRAGIRDSVQLPLAQRERQLSRSLSAKAHLQSQLASGLHSQEESDNLAKEIRELNIEYDQLQAEIRIRNPRYAALTQPRVLSPGEIQDRLLDDDTLLLEYALGEERSYLWAISKTALTSYELTAGRNIETLARRVRDSLTARQHRRSSESMSQFSRRMRETDALYRKSAGELSQTLLGPAAEKLGARRLIIVPDGFLQYVPFGALPVPRRDKDGAASAAPAIVHLIDEHEIVELPSASILFVLRQQIPGRERAAKAIAVFADPVFQRDDPRLKPSTMPDALSREQREAIGSETTADPTAYPRLVFSSQEAEDIAAVAAGAAISWTGVAANRGRALSRELSDCRIVHFATHGEINDTDPNLSGIVLSMYDAQGRRQDGFLRLLDVYRMNLRSDLVVLSACGTGLGKDVRGEGLIGLVRGFMYAGAARVVASLWKVDDASTAQLMKRFYRGMLQDGLSPAAALRTAQVELSKNERWSAPYYWAAFVLQGECR